MSSEGDNVGEPAKPQSSSSPPGFFQWAAQLLKGEASEGKGSSVPAAAASAACIQDAVLKKVSLASLSPHPARTGRPLNRRTVQELAASFEVCGMLNPLVGCPNPNGKESDSHFMVLGAHREAAARQLGWTHINMLVYPHLADTQVSNMSWHEDSVRRVITELEQAYRIRQLSGMGYTLDQIMAITALPRTTVLDRLKVALLGEAILGVFLQFSDRKLQCYSSLRAIAIELGERPDRTAEIGSLCTKIRTSHMSSADARLLSRFFAGEAYMRLPDEVRAILLENPYLGWNAILAVLPEFATASGAADAADSTVVWDARVQALLRATSEEEAARAQKRPRLTVEQIRQLTGLVSSPVTNVPPEVVVDELTERADRCCHALWELIGQESLNSGERLEARPRLVALLKQLHEATEIALRSLEQGS